MSIPYTFTAVPNSYIEEGQRLLNGSCQRVMLVILRLTRGHQRNGHTMTTSFLEKLCGMPGRTIRAALARLKKLELIKVELRPFQGRDSKFISLCERIFTKTAPLKDPETELPEASTPEASDARIVEECLPEVPAVVATEQDVSAAVSAPVTAAPELPRTVPTTEPVVVNKTLLKGLLGQGVEFNAAQRLLGQSEEIVQTALANLSKHKDVRNPAGWLHTEIMRGGYKLPVMVSKEQQIRNRHERIASERRREREATERAQLDGQRAYDRALQVYATLPSSEQERLKAQARKDAGRVPVGATMECPILRGFVLEQLVHRK